MVVEAYKRRDFLNLLGKSKTKHRRNLLIELADRGELNAVCECIDNVLRGNVRLPRSKINKLNKYKKHLRLLTKKRLSNKKRKATLKQHGGFLSILLPTALSLLSTIAKPLLGLK